MSKIPQDEPSLWVLCGLGTIFHGPNYSTFLNLEMLLNTRSISFLLSPKEW